MNDTNETNENAALCAECGGVCCKHLPGACMPADFDMPAGIDKLVAAIKSGRYCFDQWEGDPRVKPSGPGMCDAPYVRPAVKGQEGKVRDFTWGGACTFHTPNGCTLQYNMRPTACRELVPLGKGKRCGLSEAYRKAGYSNDKQVSAVAWLDFGAELAKVMELLQETT